MYTSRLPVSIRRPSSQVSSTSRPSNIPQTVRKPNLFTPQTKHRSFSIGNSTAGKSTISGLNTERKFQRPTKPLPDKDEQMKIFQNLVDFMKKNAPDIPPPEAKKFFSSVSTTESLRIFQILISCLLPDFKVIHLEKDVPEALTLLRYPYIRTVTRSSLVCVTTRQAAVGLLVIFDWLIRYIDCDQELSDDDDPPITEQIIRIITKENPTPEARSQFFEKLLQRPDLETERLELESIYSELEELQCQKDDLDELNRVKKTYDEDILKSCDYIKELEKYCQQNKEKLNEELQKESKLKLRLETLKERNHKISLESRNHEYSLEKISNTQNELKISKSENEKLKDKIDKSNMRKKDVEQSKIRISVDHKQRKTSILTSFRRLIEICETDFEFDTPNMDKMKKILTEWASKLVQMIENDDPEQNLKFQNDINSVSQELSSQYHMVESELKEGIADLKQKINQLQNAINEGPEVLEKLNKSMRRLVEEGKNEELADKDYLMNLTKKVEREQIELEDAINRQESIETTLNMEKGVALQQLEVAKVKASESKELYTELLNTTCLRVKQEQANLLKFAEDDFARWQEFHRVISQNSKVIKTKFVKIKKKLSKN